MRVPRILHQSWKDEKIPYDVYPREWIESSREKHPDWEYRYRTDDDNDRLVREHYPEFLDAYLAFDQGIKRADFSRLLYLHRFGGLNVDLDFACLKNVEPLLEDFDNVLGYLSDENPHYRVPNAFMASSSGLEFWLQVARDAASASDDEKARVEAHTGPMRLESALERYSPANVKIHDYGMIYPFDWVHFLDHEHWGRYRADIHRFAWDLRKRSVA